MTEEEAGTNWCPFARVGSSKTGLGGHNREHPSGFPEGAQCVGSKCMAFRLDVEGYDDAFEQWDDAGNIGGLTRGPAPELYQFGYCGLAGKA